MITPTQRISLKQRNFLALLGDNRGVCIKTVFSPRGLTRYLSFFFFGRPQGPQRRSSRSPLGLESFSADIFRAIRAFKVFMALKFWTLRAIWAWGSFLFSCCCSYLGRVLVWEKSMFEVFFLAQKSLWQPTLPQSKKNLGSEVIL